MPEFEKGPWEVIKSESKYVFYIENKEVGIAKCYKEADAKLISASPDMYEALKEIVNLYSYCMPLEKAKAALTKAEKGEV